MAASAAEKLNKLSNNPVLPEGGSAERVDVVQLEALVVLKILKHARENPQEQVSGPLLGLVSKHTLEVTNCFAAVVGDDDEDEDAEKRYQVKMMQCLREVNVDHLQVGWYQSTHLESFLTPEVIATQFEHQNQIEESIVLFHDPIRSAQGALSFRAYRLSQEFMAVYKANSFTPAALKEKNITCENVFEEIPIVIRNSQLSRALMVQLEENQGGEVEAFDRLDLSTHTFLEKNVRHLMECVDDLSQEAQKYNYYQRNLARQQQQQQQYFQRRKLENEQRAAQELPPLPKDDTSNNPMFKEIPAPSRLDSLLITGQINSYCRQISQFASSSFAKLFLTVE